MKGTPGRRVIDPFLLAKERRLSVQEQLDVLTAKVAGVEKELLALRLAMPGEGSLRALIQQVYAEQLGEMEQLRDDAVKILTGLVKKGLVTQEELNAMVTRGD